jgi:hypothetical protein
MNTMGGPSLEPLFGDSWSLYASGSFHLEVDVENARPESHLIIIGLRIAMPGSWRSETAQGPNLRRESKLE